MGERSTEDAEVAGSSPALPTIPYQKQYVLRLLLVIYNQCINLVVSPMGAMGEELEQVDEPIEEVDVEEKARDKIAKELEEIRRRKPKPVSVDFLPTKRIMSCSLASATVLSSLSC